MSITSSKKLSASSIFLGKYASKKKLGKGAFGDVFLVQFQNQQYAIKVIDKKKMLGENQHLAQYLQGEIACMKDMDYKYIVELKQFKEDDDYYYMVLQYCNGGDLMNLQATEPNKVFSLAKASQYLSQVIYGLEALHKKGYLHRDIKPQNVLVKNINGALNFKIADFGFTKKAKNVEGTVLGTQQYMSPQIYKQGIEGEQEQKDEQVYGYEVDMWAFGVLLFYLLNLQYPFTINPYWTIDVKYKELCKQAEGFSYRKAVANTRKKILQNCTDEVEDLFRKIFRIDRQKRINFSQVRQHPVFAKYFPKPSPQSQILYKSKFKSAFLGKGKNIQSNKKLMEKASILEKQRMAIPSAICEQQRPKYFSSERHILDILVEEIQFLREVVNQVQVVEKQIGTKQSLMFSFNLIKYHIVLYKDFIDKLKVKDLNKRFPGLDWAGYLLTPQFNQIKRKYATSIHLAQQKYADLFDKCRCQYEQLCKLNDSFGNSFDEEIKENDFGGQFYRSYRKSTDLVYSTLKEFLKTNKILKFYYFLCISCICHVFSDLNESDQLKKETFSAFRLEINDTVNNIEYVRYQKLAHYLRGAQKQVLLKLAKQIIEDIMMMKK